MVDDAGDDGRDRERADSYVVFQLGRESYALEVARVREVLDLGQLTRVPGGAGALSGLCNLRGHVVPVWDLRIPFRLGDDGGPAAASPCVLMVEPDRGQPARVAGLLVDRVSDVLDVRPEDLQEAPSVGLGDGAAFVRALIRRRDGFILAIDLDRVFEALAKEPTPEAP